MEKFRIVLLDQRGTGRSSRIDSALISAFESGEKGADYLTHFRADSIVRDAEAFRVQVFGGTKWLTLGQSYGGFITLAYLSCAPEALAACLVTGGLPSITPDAREVYRRTYPRVELKNRVFHRRYPHDVDALARIADRIAVGDVRLPDGDLLTVRRLQSLGIDFGMRPGFERIHWLIDEAFRQDSDELSDAFLQQVQQLSSFADNPLFAVMQESIYGSGPGATGWAAQAEREQHLEFDAAARPLMLTGEMIYPWMFSEIAGLQAFEPAVNVLAGREEWSELYDVERLATNDVPVVAAVYFDDMYVDSGLQLETAQRVGNLYPWVTNEYEHDGLGAERVFQHLTSTLADNGGVKTDD